MSGSAVMPFLVEIECKITNDNLKTKDALIIGKTACGMDAILAICMAECAFGFIFANGKANKRCIMYLHL